MHDFVCLFLAFSFRSLKKKTLLLAVFFFQYAYKYGVDSMEKFPRHSFTGYWFFTAFAASPSCAVDRAAWRHNNTAICLQTPLYGNEAFWFDSDFTGGWGSLWLCARLYGTYYHSLVVPVFVFFVFCASWRAGLENLWFDACCSTTTNNSSVVVGKNGVW